MAGLPGSAGVPPAELPRRNGMWGRGIFMTVIPASCPVIPAKAGIQTAAIKPAARNQA